MGATLLLLLLRQPLLMMTKLLMLLQWRQWLPETGNRVSNADKKELERQKVKLRLALLVTDMSVPLQSCF